MLQYNKNVIASNGHNGGILHEVKFNNNQIYNSYRVLTNRKYDKKLSDLFSIKILDKALNDSLKLHSKINTILIGWDVIICEDNYYFLEGNFMPGNVFPEDYYFYDKFNIIKKISY
jgi:D-alanine-D-alanine ligase-like ATP-grasp enzyme